MRKQIYIALTAVLLIVFIGLSVTSVRNSNQKLQLHEIELKSKETKLIELNQKYDEVIQLKTETDQQKEEQLKKIQDLETERQRLERELQAKLDRNKAEQEKLATAAKNASGLKVASAASSNCRDWMTQAGIPHTAASDKLILNESNCNPAARNKSSGACGIPQAYPCSKLQCPLNQSGAVCQLKWMQNYVVNRYGSWEGALSAWYSRCGSKQGCWY